MDFSTQHHLMALRKLLTYRLHELQSEVNAAEREKQQALPISACDVQDLTDEAVEGQASAIVETQERRDIDELLQVEAALDRLNAGTYGDCLDCGVDIGLQRLMVQPAASRCAECQAAWEASHHI